MTTPAFAAVQRGSVIVATVSSTERAAKINYLVACCGVQVFDNTAPEAIDYWFNLQVHERGGDVTVRPVLITVGELN